MASMCCADARLRAEPWRAGGAMPRWDPATDPARTETALPELGRAAEPATEAALPEAGRPAAAL
eukprot:9491371-Pyramimonas_sp.AAC.1